MKKTLVILTTLVATSAFAGSMTFEGRIDADNASYNKDAGKPGYSKYYLQTGRIDYKGQASEDLSYRLRIRFNKALDKAENKRDALTDMTDFASMTQKFGDMSLTLGKFDIGTAGFEGATSGADLYSTSVAYGKIGRYHTGLMLSYVLGDNTLSVLNTNLPADATTGGNFDQTKSISGLVYKGQALEKALAYMFSYHTYGLTFGTEQAANTYMTLGVQYKMDAITAAFDYNTYSLPTSATLTDSVNSMVLAIGYKVDEMNTVKFKYDNSVETTDGATDVKTTTSGMGLVLEHTPVKEANHRYHVAYTTKSAKADTTGAKTTTENHFIVGTRFAVDFLK